MHTLGERARVVRQRHRANFEAQYIFKVTFEDGSTGAAFEDELQVLTEAEAAAQ